MSRSVTVAVAYIMSVSPLNWREALKVVRAGRAVANPNLGFQRQLQEFETYKLLEVRKYIMCGDVLLTSQYDYMFVSD